MAQLTCTVVTPEATILERQADFIAVPLYDGELGVLPGHSPLIGRLGYGELRLRSGDAVVRWYLDGGFVQVADDVVSVLTSRAIEAEDIDFPAAEEQLVHAMARPAHTEELLESRDRDVARARAQMRVYNRTQSA